MTVAPEVLEAMLRSCEDMAVACDKVARYSRNDPILGDAINMMTAASVMLATVARARLGRSRG